MKANQAEFQKKWAKVIAKAWSDPAYKKKLLENPEATLAAEGISMPKGIHVEIHETTNKVVHLNLPQRPEGDLSEEQLLKVAAGSAAMFASAVC
ncbi:MAG: NHLP leader peptide family RiPP precursor [Verrucomicrobia bacterium]|nr:NHLP leader peptide family RiPP precursor [Verrucomicrobiota bacterium]